MSACYKKKIKLQKQKAKQVTFPENTSLCDKVCQVTCDKSGFLHNKSDSHDITEIF